MAAEESDNRVTVGDVTGIGGEVNIAGGDIYKGYTAEQVSALLTQISSTFQTRPFDGRCPYKGLEVFEEEDAGLFFGRDRLVQDLTKRVKESRTVFVTGPSGSGKSSLVRAGLIPALKKGAIEELHSERWCYETMRPGRDPMAELARVTASIAGTLTAGDDIRTKGLADKTILAQWCEIALKEGNTRRAVIFIDQFEEVFTQITKEQERRAFLDLLTHAVTVQNGRVILLFAMRSDFISSCATYPELNSLLNQQFMQVGAMRPDELVSAIAKPALRVGLRIDPDLIAQIIDDMRSEPGALPLMQFALKDLFDSNETRDGVIALTFDDYIQRGGIHKSLERHADSSFEKLTESEQTLARSIFGKLIEIGRGTQDTRRTALLDELVPADTNAQDVSDIIHKLADARLIITDEQAGKDTVTISHEKLIDAWPWLKNLVNENREVIALQNEIANDAKEWEEHKRDPSYLYAGVRLASAIDKLELYKLTLSDSSYEFLAAAQKQQRHSRLFRSIGIAAPIGLVIVGIITFSLLSAASSAKEAKLSDDFAKTQQALVATSEKNAEEAQRNAEEAQKNAKEVKDQTIIALAKELAAQAQIIFTTRNTNQDIAVLLSVLSMQLVPSISSSQVLQKNTLAHPIAKTIHDDYVYAVSFSPDGRYVATSSWDNTARVWEASTGKEIARMPYEGPVYSVDFSPDGKYIVSAGCDAINTEGYCLSGSARVWEANTGKEVARMHHSKAVYTAIFNKDGKYVASGSQDNTARVWEVATGKEVARFTHAEPVFSVSFSPDGRYVVSGESDHDKKNNGSYTALVWEANTGKKVAWVTHSEAISAVSFSPDGVYVVSGSWDKTALVWKANTGKVIARKIHDDYVTTVAFSPDGRYVVSGSRDNTASVWEVNTGIEVAHIDHNGVVNSVAFSRDSKYVVSGSFDNTARVWDITTDKEVARLKHETYVYSVAFSPDGRYVVSGSWDNTARVWEATSGEEVSRMIHNNVVSSIAFSPDSTLVASGSKDHSVIVWETTTDKEINRWMHYGPVYSIAFSPDGKYIATGSGDGNGRDPGGNTAHVWDATTGKEIARVTHDLDVSSVAFSPDGKYIASGSWDGTVRIWEAATGNKITQLMHENSVYSVVFSPDGKNLASGSGDKTVRVWEVTTGKEIVRMTHDNFVNAIAFSWDGRYVVSGSGDNTACVWKVSTGKLLSPCVVHEDNVLSVAFSPDGRYAASGSKDNTARVWEVTTGTEFARVTHDDDVYAVAFSPDGRYVGSGSWDKTARVWEVTTGKEIAYMTHEYPIFTLAFSPNGKYLASGSYTTQVWIYKPEDLIADACENLTRNLKHAEWEQYIRDAMPYRAVCSNLPIEPQITPSRTPIP